MQGRKKHQRHLEALHSGSKECNSRNENVLKNTELGNITCWIFMNFHFSIAKHLVVGVLEGFPKSLEKHTGRLEDQSWPRWSQRRRKLGRWGSMVEKPGLRNLDGKFILNVMGFLCLCLGFVSERKEKCLATRFWSCWTRPFVCKAGASELLPFLLYFFKSMF